MLNEIHLIYLIYISKLVITKIYKSANATLHLKRIKPKKRKKVFSCVQGQPYFFKVEDIGGGVCNLQSSSRRLHTFDKDKNKDKEKDKEF